LIKHFTGKTTVPA